VLDFPTTPMDVTPSPSSKLSKQMQSSKKQLIPPKSLFEGRYSSGEEDQEREYDSPVDMSRPLPMRNRAMEKRVKRKIFFFIYLYFCVLF
jgi:hypothetical protein